MSGVSRAMLGGDAVAKKATRKNASKRTKAPTKRKTPARKRTASSTRTKTKGTKKEPSTMASARTTVKGALAGAAAAVTKRLPGDTDAIAILERDHRKLEDLLKKGKETGDNATRKRTALLATIVRELRVHEELEETLLYPSLKEHAESKDLALEGYQEHHVADVLVKELDALPKDDERWGAKFKVLQENLEHHIGDEEGPMFRTARGVLTRDQLQSMGARMMQIKKKRGVE
jgi:hypothetical protein